MDPNYKNRIRGEFLSVDSNSLPALPLHYKILSLLWFSSSKLSEIDIEIPLIRVTMSKNCCITNSKLNFSCWKTLLYKRLHWALNSVHSVQRHQVLHRSLQAELCSLAAVQWLWRMEMHLWWSLFDRKEQLLCESQSEEMLFGFWMTAWCYDFCWLFELIIGLWNLPNILCLT